MKLSKLADELDRISGKVPTLEALLKLRAEMAREAQKVYDDWEVDEDGLDPEIGTGGICDQVAESIAGVLADHGYEPDEGGHDGDDHAFIVIRTGETTGFHIDIPWGIYEKKHGWFNYTKIPGVRFSPDDVEIAEF